MFTNKTIIFFVSLLLLGFVLKTVRTSRKNKKNKLIAWLKANGQTLQANCTVQKIENIGADPNTFGKWPIVKRTKKNLHRQQFTYDLQWVDQNGQNQTYTHQTLGDHRPRLAQSKTLPILVDPNNSSRFYVELFGILKS